jgi:hypothetical protein
MSLPADLLLVHCGLANLSQGRFILRGDVIVSSRTSGHVRQTEFC